MSDKTPNGTPMSSVDIVAMQAEVAELITAKGWDQDNRSFGNELALIASKLAEALEAYRAAGFDEWETYQIEVMGHKLPKMTGSQLAALGIAVPVDMIPRREGVAPELAGTLVRLLDTCARHGIDLGREFRMEMDYNWTRTHRHGGKRL